MIMQGTEVGRYPGLSNVDSLISVYALFSVILLKWVIRVDYDLGGR